MLSKARMRMTMGQRAKPRTSREAVSAWLAGLSSACFPARR